MNNTAKDTSPTSATNQRTLADRAYKALIGEALRKGFFGAATLTVKVQDGHVQQVRIATDRMVR